MREILFKAKTEMIVGAYNCGKEDGEWVQGYLRCDCGKWLIYQFETDRADQVAYEVNPDTICQYIGLTDKNGNKIWENDVVERVDRRNGIYVFREQPKMNCKVTWTDRHGYDTEPSCGYFDKRNALECEVIGNIFDNPELLNNKTEF